MYKERERAHMKAVCFQGGKMKDNSELIEKRQVTQHQDYVKRKQEGRLSSISDVKCKEQVKQKSLERKYPKIPHKRHNQSIVVVETLPLSSERKG